jgi:hypothetical protein
LVQAGFIAQKTSKNKNDVNPTIGYKISGLFWQNGSMTMIFDFRVLIFDWGKREWHDRHLVGSCAADFADVLRLVRGPTQSRSGEKADAAVDKGDQRSNPASAGLDRILLRGAVSEAGRAPMAGRAWSSRNLVGIGKRTWTEVYRLLSAFIGFYRLLGNFFIFSW